MNLILHPITPQQRSEMPRFNNLEKHGLSDSFFDRVKNAAENAIEKGTGVYNQVNEAQAAFDRAQKAYEDPNYGQPPVAKTDQKQRETYMLYGSVAALVVVALVAKKYVFND